MKNYNPEQSAKLLEAIQVPGACPACGEWTKTLQKDEVCGEDARLYQEWECPCGYAWTVVYQAEGVMCKATDEEFVYTENLEGHEHRCPDCGSRLVIRIVEDVTYTIGPDGEYGRHFDHDTTGGCRRYECEARCGFTIDDLDELKADDDNEKDVVISVHGGVADLVSKPEGFTGRVLVRDYDVEGCDENQLQTDEDGDRYRENEFVN